MKLLVIGPDFVYNFWNDELKMKSWVRRIKKREI